jgi:plastocyanin
MYRTKHRLFFLTAVGAIAALAACGGGADKGPDTSTTASQQAPPTPGAPLTPAAGGKVVPIEMMTDDQGNNKFSPNKFEVHPGDVLRFTLVSGVHNVHFLPDSNAAAQGLPEASPLLQAPGQTFDIAVNFKPGHYYFQCDPHALLGMTGRMEVEERE